MRSLVVSTLDAEGCGIDADLHRRWPVGVHLSVLMVVALELQLQVRPRGKRMTGAHTVQPGPRGRMVAGLTSASVSCRQSLGAGRHGCSQPDCAAGGRVPGPPHLELGRSGVTHHKDHFLQAEVCWP